MSMHSRSRLVGRLRRISHSEPDAGFSLLEVIVSFVIFSIVAGSATAAIVSALRASHSSQQRVDAANVAQSFIAAAQTNTASVTPDPGTQLQASVKNEQFTVTRTVVFSPSGATTCTSGNWFTIHVSVAQAQSPHKFLARSDTVVTC